MNNYNSIQYIANLVAVKDKAFIADIKKKKHAKPVVEFLYPELKFTLPETGSALSEVDYTVEHFV